MAEVRVVGRDGEDVPDGERGDMCIRGDNVMAGYWKNPEATAEVLRDGWYQTGMSSLAMRTGSSTWSIALAT